MGTFLGPKYIPYTYMDPLGYFKGNSRPWGEFRSMMRIMIIQECLTPSKQKKEPAAGF